jgi:putative hydrolase of the HAD superfamily
VSEQKRLEYRKHRRFGWHTGSTVDKKEMQEAFSKPDSVKLDDIDLSGVKGVLLDLDNTLYCYDPCHLYALAACEEAALKQYSVTREVFKTTWKEARSKVNSSLQGHGASHSRLLYFHKQSELIERRSNPAYALQMESIYWNSFFENMQLTAEAAAFLEKLKLLRIKSCIVTDLTTQVQMQKWTQLGLDQYIDFLVTSEEAGVEKPDAAIFQLALEKLNMTPSEVIMVGDNADKDIKGAQQMRIKAYLVEA